MVKIKEAIVVEGKYDKNTLRQIVDATVFLTNGFGIIHDKTQLQLLRQVAKTRGLIVLTDADGAGFVIRNKLRGAIPEGRVLHAYIPDVFGKERRKTTPGKEGKLGVEGMKPEVILEALRRAGATFEDGSLEQPAEPVTKTDFFTLGLTGSPDSKERRAKLLQKLQFPSHMSTNALLEAVNVLYSREQFLALFEEET